MVSFILPGNSATGGYEVANSLRFNRGSSDYLNRTLGTPTNVDKATFSTWVKFCDVTSSNDTVIFGVYTDGNNTTYFERIGDATLRLIIREGSSYIGNIQTNRKLRDPSAWMHIVIAFDTTQGTGSNRVKLYINGVQETSFSTGTYPTQNVDLRFNTSGQVFNIGNRGSNVNYPDAYFAETVFIDGQQLDSTSFGEFDEDTGIWKPIDVSGLTFGNNGFYLDFEDSSALGNDAAGSNNFTVNNLTAVDQSTDTCTNNFCTYNPLKPDSFGTFSEGNLVCGVINDYGTSVGTIGVSSGKWFCEIKIGATDDDMLVGVVDTQDVGTDSTMNYPGDSTNSVGYYRDGRKFIANSASTYGNTFTNGDIIGIALNMDDNEVKFYKNGTVQNSGTAISLPTTGDGTYVFAAGGYAGDPQANFGSPPYSESGGNSDGNGYGNFSMAVPSGYYALNTKNLAEYG